MLAIIMICVLGGCGAKKDENPNVLELGDYTATYKSYEIVKDDYDKDTVIITFDYTNNSEEADSWLWSISYEVKQGETKLEAGTIIDPETFDSVFDTEMAKIEPGATAEVKLAYNLADSTTDVVIEASDFNAKYNDTLTVKIAE